MQSTYKLGVLRVITK